MKIDKETLNILIITSMCFIVVFSYIYLKYIINYQSTASIELLNLSCFVFAIATITAVIYNITPKNK